MKNKILISSIITTILLFSGCDTKSSIDESVLAKPKEQIEKVKEEFVSQTFKLVTTDDKIIEFTSTEEGLDFKDYKGNKAILIDVFATWCPPCIEELPILKELREKYKNDFEIVSVLFEKDKPKEEVLQFIKEHSIQYPVTVGEENFKLAKELGDIQKVPEMFLFTKNGDFVKKFVGKTSKEKLEGFILDAISK
jgi:thiol-disulfide isomerase/thioredoxin